MAYEQKDMSGVLFTNADKQKDTHADMRGSITINGVQYWLDGWWKESKDGSERLSLSAKPKQAAAKSAPASAKRGRPQPASGNDDYDDSDIPF